ncbi:MAG: PIN domain-containing protein [bacterium]
MYVLLMKKGADLLGNVSRWRIREQIEKNHGFAQECYQKIDAFLEYIGELKSSALSIVNVDYDIFYKSVEIGKEYGLITRDAIHSATCKTFNISHIATNDEHFDKVEFLSVWKPIVA